MLPNHKIHFSVTGTFVSPANERSAKDRKPLLTRMRDPLMVGHLLYLIVAGLALITCLFINVYSTSPKVKVLDANHYETVLNQYVFTGAILRLLDIFTSALIPVSYMIWPPTVPERRNLLQKDNDGVYRAKNKDFVIREAGITWKDALEVLVILTCDWC